MLFEDWKPIDKIVSIAIVKGEGEKGLVRTLAGLVTGMDFIEPSNRIMLLQIADRPLELFRGDDHPRGVITVAIFLGEDAVEGDDHQLSVMPPSRAGQSPLRKHPRYKITYRRLQCRHGVPPSLTLKVAHSSIRGLASSSAFDLHNGAPFPPERVRTRLRLRKTLQDEGHPRERRRAPVTNLLRLSPID